MATISASNSSSRSEAPIGGSARSGPTVAVSAGKLPRFTPVETKELKEMFELFSRGTSDIDTSNLGNVLLALGVELTQNELLELVDVVDVDRTGTLNFSEFIELLGMLLPPSVASAEDELKEVFKLFDKDSSGRVKATELRLVLGGLGEHGNDDAVEEMVRAASGGATDYFTYEQFKAVVK